MIAIFWIEAPVLLVLGTGVDSEDSHLYAARQKRTLVCPHGWCYLKPVEGIGGSAGPRGSGTFSYGLMESPTFKNPATQQL